TKMIRQSTSAENEDQAEVILKYKKNRRTLIYHEEGVWRPITIQNKGKNVTIREVLEISSDGQVIRSYVQGKSIIVQRNKKNHEWEKAVFKIGNDEVTPEEFGEMSIDGRFVSIRLKNNERIVMQQQEDGQWQPWVLNIDGHDKRLLQLYIKSLGKQNMLVQVDDGTWKIIHR
ncbi:MAG: hypothetical protein HQL13_08310, partial [Candidatus Omnitrophica bacterium]|nr:hypothetical protein [Candidatus Omnitrophota bacterium]